MPRGFSALPARVPNNLGPGLMPPGAKGGGRSPQGNGNGGTGAPGRVNPPGQGMMNPPGQSGQHPQRGQGAQGKGRGAANGKGVGVGNAAMPGPGGRQLQARVDSGVITEEQAQRTMRQRQTLAKALGPNWRDKLQVGGQSFAQVNKQLKANSGNAKLAAIRKKLVTNRAQVLEAARAKEKGGKGSGEGRE